MPVPSFRPRLEELGDRLSPGNLHGASALLPSHSHAFCRTHEHSDSALFPPNSDAYGRTLDEWSILYARWAIEEELGGGSNLDPTGRVAFLPGSPQPGVMEFDVALAPGTSFFVSPFFVYGETYDDPNVPPDTPQGVIDLKIFEETTVQVKLDGRVILEGVASEFDQRMFGPVYFDEPIVYTQPQPRGENLNATSAIFAQGIGTLFRPLPVGQHTLVITLHSEFFGDFQGIYHITVSPKSSHGH